MSNRSVINDLVAEGRHLSKAWSEYDPSTDPKLAAVWDQESDILARLADALEAAEARNTELGDELEIANTRIQAVRDAADTDEFWEKAGPNLDQLINGKAIVIEDHRLVTEPIRYIRFKTPARGQK